MDFLTVLFVFIFGTIIGSFLNVVILRYNTGATLGGRSKCFSCNKVVCWYDLLPVLSFFFLLGKCRACKSRLSVQYPLVEFLTGVLFLGVFLKYGVSFISLVDMVGIALITVIAVYDLRHKIIPDPAVFLFSLLALGKIFYLIPVSLLFRFPYIMELSAGPILALPIFILWVASKGSWIGLGDAKLALGIGWFLGLSLGLSSIIIGFWIGAVIGLSLICFSKLSAHESGKQLLRFLKVRSFGMKSEIPLAPFLITGVFIVYFFEINVTGLSVFGIL